MATYMHQPVELSISTNYNFISSQIMKVETIVSFLESVAPLSLQEEYDNSGLIIGNEEAEVFGVLICLDCTEAVLDEAIKKSCNLIIAHHPIIFKGLKAIAGRNYVERVVEKAIRNNISVYANRNIIKIGVNSVNGNIISDCFFCNTLNVIASSNFFKSRKNNRMMCDDEIAILFYCFI